MDFGNGPQSLGRHLFPPAIAAGVPVSVAAGVMARRGVDSLVVIEDGVVCGVLTERDLVRTVAVEGVLSDVDVADVCSRELSQLMTPEPLVMDAGTTVAAAADLMLDAGVGAAVAVDEAGHTSVVTGHDIAAATGGGQVGPDESIDVIAVEVSPLSLEDAVGTAVLAVEASGGRPVPVVDGDAGELVGIVRVALAVPSSPVIRHYTGEIPGSAG